MLKKRRARSFLLVAFLLCASLLLAFKLFTSSVSIEGDVRSVITADYWNFGKGILKGRVLYKDLVDHKGAYLFWLYAILHMVSGGSIAIVPFAETLVFALTCLSACRLCQDTLGRKKGLVLALLFSTLYALLTIHVPMLNTEPMLLPVLFLAERTVAFRKKMGYAEFFAWGCIFGLFLNAKYAAVVYIAPLAALAIFKLSFLASPPQKRAKAAFLSVLSSFVGVCAANIPFAAYLAKNGTAKAFLGITKAASYCDVKLAIACTVLAAALLVFSMARCKNGRRYISPTVFSSLVLTLPMLTMMGYMLAPIVGMAFAAVLFGKEKHLFRRAIFYAVFSGMVIRAVVLPAFNLTPTKEIAKTFGMTNANTLYLCEDLGFGSYSDEPFSEPLQWVPSKCMRTPEFASYMESLEKERVEEGRFLFIVAPCLKKNEEDKTKIDLLWDNLFQAVIERYEEVLCEEDEEDSFRIYKIIE